MGGMSISISNSNLILLGPACHPFPLGADHTGHLFLALPPYTGECEHRDLLWREGGDGRLRDPAGTWEADMCFPDLWFGPGYSYSYRYRTELRWIARWYCRGRLCPCDVCLRVTVMDPDHMLQESSQELCPWLSQENVYLF